MYHHENWILQQVHKLSVPIFDRTFCVIENFVITKQVFVDIESAHQCCYHKGKNVVVAQILIVKRFFEHK